MRPLWLLLPALLLGCPTSACSDFLFNRAASASSVVSGRTMDFQADLDTALEVVPRGTLFQELPVAGCPDCADFAWKARLGFVAANIYGVNVAADGMNEAGLSAAWLNLEASEYPSPTGDGAFNASKPVVTSVCSYILGNFASVDDVRAGLKQVQLAGVDGRVAQAILHLPMPADGKAKAAPLHVSVHDATGDNLVIEFINGEAVFHENPNGVLTNDPPLHQQLELLAKHRSETAGDINVGDLLPGGYGSTERFIRLSVLNGKVADGYSSSSVHASYLEATEEQRVVSDTLHLLNTVVRPPTGEATEWSIVRDHKRRMLYIRSTANQLLRRVSLDMLDWADPHARRLLPVSYGIWFLDSTVTLLDDSNSMRTKDIPSRSEIEALLAQTGNPPASFRESKDVQRLQDKSLAAVFQDQLPLHESNGQLQMEQQREEVASMWVFVAGCVAGGAVTVLFTLGWKILVLDRVQRQRGYQPIADS
ncbi:hypothetical protein BBJ28_00024178 [Nothophytophthora sp. Chile5]|nr:hypothetical protein BBJ28_00024178 [Nothophytophthora sp. Chile5]